MLIGWLFGCAVALLSRSLAAQGTGAIRGQVNDAATGRPVADVQIEVSGTVYDGQGS